MMISCQLSRSPALLLMRTQQWNLPRAPSLGASRNFGTRLFPPISEKNLRRKKDKRNSLSCTLVRDRGKLFWEGKRKREGSDESENDAVDTDTPPKKKKKDEKIHGL